MFCIRKELKMKFSTTSEEQQDFLLALEDAAKEAGVKIVTVTKLEAQEVSIDGFTFKATVIVEPEVEIDNYKGIEVEKKSTEVTEEMIKRLKKSENATAVW